MLTLDVALLATESAIGWAQWLVLRRWTPHAGWWIGATAGGWGLVALVSDGAALGALGLLSLGVLPAGVTAMMLAYFMRLVSASTQGDVTAG